MRTAPLRRLADRYVVRPRWRSPTASRCRNRWPTAFPKLPEVMRRADDTANQIERAVIDLAEVALLSAQTQRTFAAVVTDVDDRGARIQIVRPARGVARSTPTTSTPGDDIRVRVVSTDIPGSHCEVSNGSPDQARRRDCVDLASHRSTTYSSPSGPSLIAVTLGDRARAAPA